MSPRARTAGCFRGRRTGGSLAGWLRHSAVPPGSGGPGEAVRPRSRRSPPGRSGRPRLPGPAVPGRRRAGGFVASAV